MKSSRLPLSVDRVQGMTGVWLGLIVLLPLIPLLAPDGCFGLDWPSHLWLTAYYAEYFKQHLGFPEVIHTAQLAGMPYPVFYGVLLYPYLGVLGAVVGAAWAMRIAVAVVFLLQAWQVFRLAWQAGRDRNFAWVVAAATSWSIYGLTNLYNRGAFAEMIAVALLTAAIGALGRTLLLPLAERRGFDVALGSLCFVLAAGVHPITALCGGLFIALLAVIFFCQGEKRAEVIRWGLLGGAAAFVVLSPWLYVVAKFGAYLMVAQIDSGTLLYFEVDTVGSRLMPFPYDSRLAADYSLPLSRSPHLDVQLSTGLLVLALSLSLLAGLIHRQRTQASRAGWWVMGIFWALFFGLFVVSVTPALGAALPPLRNIQFAYRLVSYLNLSLLVIVVAGLVTVSAAPLSDRVKKGRTAVLLLVLAVTLVGLVIKWQYATERAYVIADMKGPGVVQMPRGFLGWHGYAVLSRPVAMESPQTIINVPVGSEIDFGKTRAFRIERPVAGPAEIRVQPFPWSDVRVDGRAVMTTEGTTQRAGGMIVPFAAGAHDIEYTWNPAPPWRWLNRISRAVLFLWVALVLGFAARDALRRGVRPTPAS